MRHEREDVCELRYMEGENDSEGGNDRDVALLVGLVCLLLFPFPPFDGVIRLGIFIWTYFFPVCA